MSLYASKRSYLSVSCTFNKLLSQSSKLSWMSGWLSLNGNRTSYLFYLLRQIVFRYSSENACSYLFIPKLLNSENPFKWLCSSSFSPQIRTSLVALLTKLTVCVLTLTLTELLKIHPNLVTKPSYSPDFAIFSVTKRQYKSDLINKPTSFSLYASTNSISWKFSNCFFRNVILGLDIGKHNIGRHKSFNQFIFVAIGYDY